MTSSTSSADTLARLRAAFIATVPRSCAGVLANAPLNEPTGVRAAEAITISVVIWYLLVMSLHGSVAPYPDVAAGCRLYLGKLRSTKLRARGDEVAALDREPRAPVGPPAPRHLAGCLEPGLSLYAKLAIDPEAALAARGPT